ncbi:MAG: energy transducer TonB [Prevotella sp.]|nr:energy transducer TonB [Prevotella sp.]
MRIVCRIFLLAVLLLSGLPARAQADKAPSGYSVHYEKEHLFYHKGDEMNVIDVDVEWPEMLDYSSVAPLQQYLSSRLFGVSATDFSTSYDLLKQRFGMPVCGPFQRLPEADRYCYASYLLRFVGYQPGRYASFYLYSQCNPRPLSSQVGDTLIALVTYDIERRQVLQIEDLVSAPRLYDDEGDLSNAFIGQVLDGVVGDVPEYASSIRLEGCCLMDDYLLVRGVIDNEGAETDFNSMIDYPSLKRNSSVWLKSNMKRLLKARKVKHPDVAGDTLVRRTAFRGSPIYNKVEVAPQYEGGRSALSAFLAENITYPTDQIYRKVQGKAIVSFVVGQDGTIGDIDVVSPVSPVIDREAVRVVRMMHRWKPGTIDGKPVNVRMRLPILFAVQDE